MAMGDEATAGRYEGVVFDLDGVLTDTEHLWEENWSSYSGHHGRAWEPRHTMALMGMSTPETARYLAEHTGSGEPPPGIAARLTDWMIDALRNGRVILAPGASQLVAAVACRVPIALASSAPRRMIDAVLDATGLAPQFTAAVSSEEVTRGKPSPDVYLEAARRIGRDPRRCLGVEDSSNGIKAAVAAGLAVIALPNRLYPPRPDVLALCTMVASSLAEVQDGLVTRLDGA
jgi:HAD superfamily hydrolase (TIGR01509 family)